MRAVLPLSKYFYYGDHDVLPVVISMFLVILNIGFGHALRLQFIPKEYSLPQCFPGPFSVSVVTVWIHACCGRKVKGCVS